MLADGNTNLIHADYYRGDVPSFVGEHYLDEYGQYITDGFQAGESLVINDFSTVSELSDEEQTRYLQMDICAWMGVPLVRTVASPHTSLLTSRLPESGQTPKSR